MSQSVAPLSGDVSQGGRGAAAAWASTDPTAIAAGPEPVLRLSLFGRMRAQGPDSHDLLPVGRKTRGLLAILALSAGRPVLRARLAELLWSRRPDPQARASLRQEIHRLLDALSPYGPVLLEVGRHALSLRAEAVDVDTQRMLSTETLEAVPLDPAEAVLLAELNGIDPALDAWLAGERHRIEEHRRGLYDALLTRQTDPEEAKAVARRLVALDPLHEAAWRGLIAAQTALGEHGAALQSLERCAAVFHERLGEQAPEAQPLLQRLRAMLEDAQAALEETAADAGTPPDAAADAPGAQVRSQGGPHPAAAAGDTDAVTMPRRPRPRAIRTAGLARLVLHPPEAADQAQLPRGFSHGLQASMAEALGRAPLLTVIAAAPGQRHAGVWRPPERGRPPSGTRPRESGLPGYLPDHLPDYLVEATMQAPPAGAGAPARLRVSLRALDVRAHGRLVWSEHFDRQGDDLLAFQDGIGRDLAARLPPALLRNEMRHAQSEDGDPVLRALALILRCDAESLTLADALLETSAARGDDGAEALGTVDAAARGLWHVVRHVQGLGRAPDAAVAALVARLLDDAGNALALALAGLIRTLLMGDARAGLVLQDQAVALCPSCSEAEAGAALCLALLGDGDAALTRFARHRALTPSHPAAHLLATGGLVALLMTGQAGEAAALARQHAEMHPQALPPLLLCLAAEGLLGEGGGENAMRLLHRVRQAAAADVLRAAVARLPPLVGLGLRAAGLVDAA